MKITEYKNRADWLVGREGKVTGKGLGEIVPKAGVTKELVTKALIEQGIEFSKLAKKEELEGLLPLESKVQLMLEVPKKQKFYQLISDKIETSRNGEDSMERGHRLEPEALQRFTKETGLEVDGKCYIWTRDDNDNISVSPDGVVDRENSVEVKCLSGAIHIEAFLTKQIPEEHVLQGIQHFIVNDDLQKHHFVFYNPNMPDTCDFFIITLAREELQDQIDLYLAYERAVLIEIEQIVLDLSF